MSESERTIEQRTTGRGTAGNRRRTTARGAGKAASHGDAPSARRGGGSLRGAQVVPLRPGYGISAPTTNRPATDDGDGNHNGNGHGGDGGGGDGRPGGDGDEPGKPRVRIRKLRVLALLLGLGILAVVSTVFGMMMAVASDLPHLEDPPTTNTMIVDDKGRPIGRLQGNERHIFLDEARIAPVMKHAIIAVEDQRFYTNEGVDLRGIARAFIQDVLHKGAIQGASTITQQYVKNALAAQNDRTVFEKLREAAMAYHLTRKWSKERILRDYLNTVYFGNGAYGIEAAARTYFASNHRGCDTDAALRVRPCAAQLTPGEAALLAGIVQNPSGYDPIQHPAAAHTRRNTVLLKMFQQHFLTRTQYDESLNEQLPTRESLNPPKEDTDYPYFTSWIKQQVVDELGGGQEGARLAFEGGLRVKTTIDTKMQAAAKHAVDQWLPWKDGPRAALVAIDNRTGAVRAMIGGDDYGASAFNLATQGQRQPGSSIKPFILARAYADGISPTSSWPSHKLVLNVPHSSEIFTVNNFANEYFGTISLENALTHSDNSVFAQVGIKVGTKRVAKLAHRMGIRTPLSHNWAMTIGGLKQGVTPLDMAHAYSTIADHGKLTYGSLSPGAGNGPHRIAPGPLGIESITRIADGKPAKLADGSDAVDHTRTRPVLTSSVADEVATAMRTVVTMGTGTRAAVPGYEVAGKTGTTDNYGDAWFVGWAGNYTVAVWVGYPNKLTSMDTAFQGGPVTGGTYPAAIFSTFLQDVLPDKTDTAPVVPTTPTVPETTAPTATATPAPTAATPAPTPPPSTTTPPTTLSAPNDGATAPDTGGTGTTGGGTTGGDTGTTGGGDTGTGTDTGGGDTGTGTGTGTGAGTGGGTGAGGATPTG